MIEFVPLSEQGRRFSTSRKIRLSDCGPDGLFRLDGVARYLQDVGSDDWDDVGAGSDLTWVVRRSAVHLAPSGEKMGGIGEPGVPPVAPALANALFALELSPGLVAAVMTDGFEAGWWEGTAAFVWSSVAQLKGAFAPSFTPLERSGDVFSWDPI